MREITAAAMSAAVASKQLRTQALRWTAPLSANRHNDRTHDVGFMVFDSFGKGIEYGDVSDLETQRLQDSYRSIVLDAAHALATRYSPTVGCTRSWQPGNHCRLHPSLETPFTVIIDNMMNLELLLWAGQETSNDTLTQMAVSHADKTAENHVRHVNQRQGEYRSSASPMSHSAQDGSTYHVVSYNESTGEVVARCTR